MLKRVHIQKYRSCENVSISNLARVTALVGRNAAGKTNVLRGIEAVARMATASSDEGFFRAVEFRPNEVASISIEAQIDKRNYSYTTSTEFQRPQTKHSFSFLRKELVTLQEQGGEKQEICTRKGNEVQVPEIDKPLIINYVTSSMPAILSLVPETKTAKELRPFFEFLTKIRYYALDEPSDPVYSPIAVETGMIHNQEYEKWLARYRETGEPGNSVTMRLVHMNLAKDDRFHRVVSLLGSDGLNLVDDIQVNPVEMHGQGLAETQKSRNTLYQVTFSLCKPAGGGRLLFGYPHLSLGTRRMLRIVVSVVFDGSAVILLEHPEDGVHTGLVQKLLSVLRMESESAQVIMSTHSSTVLNALQPNEIRLVEMQDGETTVRSLSPAEKNAATKYMAADGPLSGFLGLVD